MNVSRVKNINIKMVVYCIVNKTNNKKYIGITKNELKKRLIGHKTRYKNDNTRFYSAIKCYGWDNFYVEVVEQCKCEAELTKRELYWINKLKTTNKEFGYNVLCKEYKFSQARKGKKNSKKHKNLLSKSMHSRKGEMIKLHQKEWVLFSPFGERFDIINLQKFCREWDGVLYPANLVKLTTKKGEYYKGWQCFKKEDFDEKNVMEFPMQKKTISKKSILKPQQRIKFTFPNGDEFESPNVSNFCKKFNFDLSAVYKLIRTGKKYKNLKFEIIDFPQLP